MRSVESKINGLTSIYLVAHLQLGMALPAQLRMLVAALAHYGVHGMKCSESACGQLPSPKRSQVVGIAVRLVHHAATLRPPLLFGSCSVLSVGSFTAVRDGASVAAAEFTTIRMPAQYVQSVHALVEDRRSSCNLQVKNNELWVSLFHEQPYPLD